MLTVSELYQHTLPPLTFLLLFSQTIFISVNNDNEKNNNLPMQVTSFNLLRCKIYTVIPHKILRNFSQANFANS